MTTPSLTSISRRVALILACISLVGAALTSWGLSRLITHEMGELLDHTLQESADLIHNVIARAPSPDAIAAVGTVRHEYEEHLVWQVVDLQTQEVLARSTLAPAQPLHRRHEPALFDLQDATDAGRHWRVATLSMSGPSPRLLVVAQSHDERREALLEARTFSALISALGALLTTGVAYGLIRRELQRVKRLSQTVVAHDPLLHPERRLPRADREELQPIVEAVEALSQRLAQRVTSERAFTVHAAHALRTPLAGLDVQLALAVRQAPDDATRHRVEQARVAAQRLSRVLEALLAMFRTGLDPEPAWVDIAELGRSLSLPGLSVAYSGERVWCDPNLFAAVLLNLLDNAQRHGASEVAVSASRQADDFEVLVQDDGSGSEADLVDALQRALDAQDYSRSGPLRGLGLILADLVLRAHGGRARLVPTERLPKGHGFVVALRWPAPR